MQLNDQPPNALVLRPLQTPQYLPGRIRRGAGRGRDQVREQPAVRPPVLNIARGQRRRGRPISSRRQLPHRRLSQDAMEGFYD